MTHTVKRNLNFMSSMKEYPYDYLITQQAGVRLVIAGGCSLPLFVMFERTMIEGNHPKSWKRISLLPARRRARKPVTRTTDSNHPQNLTYLDRGEGRERKYECTRSKQGSRTILIISRCTSISGHKFLCISFPLSKFLAATLPWPSTAWAPRSFPTPSPPATENRLTLTLATSTGPVTWRRRGVLGRR